jgi:hypothetical protein
LNSFTGASYGCVWSAPIGPFGGGCSVELRRIASLGFLAARLCRMKKKTPIARRITTTGPAIMATRVPVLSVTLPLPVFFADPVFVAPAPTPTAVPVPEEEDGERVLVKVDSNVLVNVVVCTFAVMIVVYEEVNRE